MTQRHFIKITTFLLFAFLTAPQAEAQLFNKKKKAKTEAASKANGNGKKDKIQP